MIQLKGCSTALLTPFRDGKVDFEAYRASVRRQVESGVDFLTALATTGETPTLSAEEKLELLRITRQEAPSLPILAGCGSNSLDATIANIRLLEPLEPDAFLVVVPFYNKPTQQGQYLYFKAVSESTDIPIVIYNVPGRTGANMTADTAVRLAEDCPGIIATKEASGNFSQVSEIIRRRPEGFSVLSGDDDMTLAFMAAGADGVISVASNVAPQAVASMVHFLQEGKLDAARELHHRLFPLFKACFVESNPVPAKAAMSLLGLMKDEVRLPLSRAAESTFALMEKTLGDLSYSLFSAYLPDISGGEFDKAK